MKPSIIIIGAGLAGLSAGCYARMNGFQTRIFELHDKPGGLCTSWTRKGYTIDYSIHDLSGPRPESALYFLWEELGALKNVPMHYNAEFWRVEDEAGNALAMYTDIDRYQAQLKALSPADAALIDRYIKDVKKFTRIEFFGLLAGGIKGVMGMLPTLPAMMIWGKPSMAAFAAQFKDAFLQRAFPYLQYGFEGIPMMLHMNFLAMCHNRFLGYPVGGSLAFAKAIAHRFTVLGGELQYRAKVTKVLVEDNRAKGVRLADGSEHFADVVISAADGYTTIYNMLDGVYTNATIKGYYDAVPDRQDMNTTVGIGVAQAFPAEVRAITYLLDSPIMLAGEKRDHVDVEFYTDETGLAPQGKTTIKILYPSKYSYWKALAQNADDYKAAKQKDADALITLLDARFAGFKDKVEMVDVATPLTVERFTGNIRGSQAWAAPGGNFFSMMKGFARTLPGLQNFYLTGQWALASLGIPMVVMDGRNVIKELCHQQKSRFVTQKIEPQ